MRYKYYASDILEAAQELSQNKALNSYSFRDLQNWLTSEWQYCYERIVQIEPGFYSKTVRLSGKMTKLPPFVKSSIRVYAARDPYDMPRQVYRQASMTDLTSYGMYYISGFDLYCRDAGDRCVWLEYVPDPPFVTFTKNNRDPRILSVAPETPRAYVLTDAGVVKYYYGGVPTTPPSAMIAKSVANCRYGAYYMYGSIKASEQSSMPLMMRSFYPIPAHDGAAQQEIEVNVGRILIKPNFTIISIILDSPYIFITYQDNNTNDYESWIIQDLMTDPSWTRYNPFDFQGRGSNVEYLDAHYNDYTGMGCIIHDHADDKVKELGWTPDCIMEYPNEILRNYMVAHLASRFADLSEAKLTAVDKALYDANREMSDWMAKDKSAWMRMDRTVGRSLGDLL